MRSSTYLVNASETNIIGGPVRTGWVQHQLVSAVGGLFQFRLDEIKMEIGKIISHLYSTVTRTSQYYSLSYRTVPQSAAFLFERLHWNGVDKMDNIWMGQQLTCIHK